MSTAANPRHPSNPPSDPPSEPTGPITKDSLANESLSRNQGFAENANPEVLGVRGAQSTLATTDTSNADTLPAARSGAVREADDVTRYPDAGAGKGFEGTHSDLGYVGGGGDGVSGTGASTGVGADTGSGSGTGVRPYVAHAPVGVTGVQEEAKPKGENLVEGEGIPGDRGTVVPEVGGGSDPGRVAEREFAKANADASGGIGRRSYGTEGEGNVYEGLGRSERA